MSEIDIELGFTPQDKEELMDSFFDAMGKITEMESSDE